MHVEIFLKTNTKIMYCTDSLVKRNEKIILAYERICPTLEQTKELFPRNENIDTLKLRTRDKYTFTQSNTE